MKKKIIALMGAVLFGASMSMTAMAAPSVTAGIVTGIESAKDAEDKDIPAGTIGMKAADENNEDVKNIKKVDTLKDTLGDGYVEGMGVADVKEVTAEVGIANPFPAKIRFAAKGVKAGDKVAVLLNTADGWTVLEDVVAGNGTITVTVPSAGTLAFVTKAAVTSPTTGVPVLAAAAVVALGVVGTVSSKKKA